MKRTRRDTNEAVKRNRSTDDGETVAENLNEDSASSQVVTNDTEFCVGQLADQLLEIELEQAKALLALTYSHPVAYIYNPLEYASDTHCQFIRRFCTNPKKVLFVGINPGPFGMAQTGVPFGEVSVVKNWLQITGTVQKPAKEHPKRPILGLDCPRNEVSGQRFWGFFQDICGTPEGFFRNAFVHNYCPLVFMKDSAKNVTPNELPVLERRALQEICDEALRKVVRLLQVEIVVGMGRFAQNRVKTALRSVAGLDNIPVEFLMHPSPINPAANRGWKDIAHKQLSDMNVLQYLVANELKNVAKPDPKSLGSVPT